MWTYFGITVERAPVNSSGIRWTALVDFPSYSGYLKADTKAGMRDLIREKRQRSK